MMEVSMPAISRLLGIDPPVADFRFWLQADIQPPEIEVCSYPNTGHSEAHAGLPLVTQPGHWRDEPQPHPPRLRPARSDRFFAA